MNTLFVVAAVVVLLIVAFIAWQRRVVRRQAEGLEQVARGIRDLRTRSKVVPTMNRVATEGSGVPAQFAPIQAELEREGLRMLGDVEELNLDGSVAGRLRWFASNDGTIWGWFGLANGVVPVMLMLSEDAGRGFTATIRSPHAPSTVSPETVRELRLRWEEGLDAALDGQRAAVTAMAAPVRVTDLDGAIASLHRLKEHTNAWRTQQDPDALLEADVRNIVGDRYDELGEPVMALVAMLEMFDTSGSAADRP
ncbi:MAG TPA: hypothetical protein VF039_11270 [Longimicrobiales bacterium]